MKNLMAYKLQMKSLKHTINKGLVKNSVSPNSREQTVNTYHLNQGSNTSSKETLVESNNNEFRLNEL